MIHTFGSMNKVLVFKFFLKNHTITVIIYRGDGNNENLITRTEAIEQNVNFAYFILICKLPCYLDNSINCNNN